MSKTIDHSKRAHALLSASSANRWLACPPSAVAQELYVNTGSVFTREGTIAHEVAEILASSALLNKPLSKPPAEHTVEMIDCAKGYAEYIQEQINCDNPLILLEQRVDFSPWVPDGFGTADCIIIQGDTMDVIDYKYGKGVSVSAEENPQMMLYGLGALNDYGFAYDIENIRLHIYQPRINNISVYTITIDKLMEWSEKVKRIAALAAKGEGEYHAGDHCTFCLHAGRCRELHKTCAEYVKHRDMTIAVPTLTPGEVAEALEMEPLVSLWLNRVKTQALTDMLNGENIPGYKVVAGRPGNRKWKDELKVAETLEAAGYGPGEYTEVKLLSPAALEKSIGKKTVNELIASHIERAPGTPVIAPETDKRPAYDRAAEMRKEFMEAEA